MRIPVWLLSASALCACMLGACLLAACAAPTVPIDDHVAVLLLGEQHDVAEHQQLHRDVIQALADRGRLAAVTIEMAEQGRDTAGLPATASEAQVQQALQWEPRAWPWASYGPAVMAAVRAGVTVRGANLPRGSMPAAMHDGALDALLPATVFQAQQQAIRTGHCGLLPDSQVVPMTRIQIARDRAMAQALAAAVVPGKTVVLVAGAGHVDPALGVPLHLPAGIAAKPVMLPGEPPVRDHCADLRRTLQTPGSKP